MASAEVLQRIAADIYDDRIAHGHGDSDDLLRLLMEATDEETGERMDRRQVLDELLTFTAAGHETTAHGLSWMYYLLSQHPAAREQLKVVAKATETRIYEGDLKGEAPGSNLVERLAKEAKREAMIMGCDTLIVDTAGRLGIDEELMQEMERLKKLLTQNKVQTHETVVLLLTGHTLKDSDYTIAYHRGDLLRAEEIGDLRPEIELTCRNAVELDASVDMVLRELEKAASDGSAVMMV